MSVFEREFKPSHQLVSTRFEFIGPELIPFPITNVACLHNFQAV